MVADATSFLIDAYATRSRAATTGDASLLDPLYDTANPALLAFEKDRARFMARGIGARWGGTIEQHASAVSVLDVAPASDGVRARIVDRVTSTWQPNGAAASTRPAALTARQPAKYAAPPLREINSLAGIRHEVTLSRSSGGWRIQRDEHDEWFLYGRSPDLRPGAWAATQYGVRHDIDAPRMLSKSSVKPAPTGRAGLARPLGYTFYYMDSVNYAHTYCFSYNGSYCNYNYCGGDCANFVSQSLRAGGHWDANGWGTYWGDCCSGASGVQLGTYAWVNNEGLRNFVINQGRGNAAPDVTWMGYADLINYDWNGDGIYDHVCLVTYPWVSASNPALITCHNNDLYDYPWDLGAVYNLFTYTYVDFAQ
jgi:hypothetical protein